MGNGSRVSRTQTTDTALMISCYSQEVNSRRPLMMPLTEIPTWFDQVAGVLAIGLLVGGVFMMLSNIWTLK